MPRKYERTTLRASWTAEDLEEAMDKVKKKQLGVNEASRTFKIPSRTLRRHLLTGKSKGPLGRQPVFCEEHEKKLVAHIKKLELVGFAPERKDVKEMAFQLAKKLNVKNPFSKKSETAGNVWFNGFMARNPELSQRKSEGLSLARAYGVNRKDVQDFFDLLAKIYEENDFANHPEDVYNMDESGIQVNNKPGKVIATKGAKDVYTLTSCEKGDNGTLISCCNAQGNFLPPVLIYKGTYSKPQFSEGLPPGSQVFMNKKSSYINSDLFMKWFEEVFLRHKSPRKALLILDGHSSHSNNIRLLEIAKEKNVILLCLPSHTTHALQPLDRAFFRPLKVYFAQEAKAWMVRNKDKKLTRYDVSKLIGKAWGKAATISNGISALKSCGIFPYNPSAIPEHYFAMSDSLQDQNLIENVQEEEDRTPSPSVLEQLGVSCGLDDLVAEHVNEPTPGPSGVSHKNTEQHKSDQPSGLNTGTDLSSDEEQYVFEPELAPSGLCTAKSNSTPQKGHGVSELATPQETPTKVLSNVYPVPKLPAMLTNKKQKAVILTSPENIQKRRVIYDKKKLKIQRQKSKQTVTAKLGKMKVENKRKKGHEEDDEDQIENKETKRKKSKRKETASKKNTPRLSSPESTGDDDDQTENRELVKKKPRKKEPGRKKKVQKYSSSSSESNDKVDTRVDISEEEISDEDVNRCTECTESYYETQSTEDWIQCPSCLAWMHEFCTMYNPLCNRCGRKSKRETVRNK